MENIFWANYRLLVNYRENEDFEKKYRNSKNF